MKKIFLIFYGFGIFLFFGLSFLKNTELIDFSYIDGTGETYKIYNTSSDSDTEIIERYSMYSNVSISTEQYLLLSCVNYSQQDIAQYYDNLGNKRLDLNNDGLINNNDNLDLVNGFCQPTAVAIALRYAYMWTDFDYDEDLDLNKNDINNVFYEVAQAYKYNGWTGGGFNRVNCKNCLNTIFSNNNNDYCAKYATSQSTIYNQIVASYNQNFPIIAHITSTNGACGHAVAVCGYRIINVNYYSGGTKHTEKIKYAIVNDTWYSSGMSDGPGGISSSVFALNYSFIEMTDIDAVTYVEEV